MAPKFEKETDLCAAFIKVLPDDWQAYQEWGGFDILLVRKADGFQIGIEAKLRLNAKVIGQAAERIGPWYSRQSGPDCRAVLVPWGAGEDLIHVCNLLGITVIKVFHPDDKDEWHWEKAYGFRPELPKINGYDACIGHEWFEIFPDNRVDIPDHVPDVRAGDKSPIMLTPWKINAIKIAVLLDRTGYVTRTDFKELRLSMSRWCQGGLLAWLQPGPERGKWQKGKKLPDFKSQHPVNYEQISAEFDNWNPRKAAAPQPMEEK